MTERFISQSIDERAELIDRIVAELRTAQLEQHTAPVAARLRLEQLDRKLASNGYGDADRRDMFQTAADFIQTASDIETDYELRRMLYE